MVNRFILIYTDRKNVGILHYIAIGLLTDEEFPFVIYFAISSTQRGYFLKKTKIDTPSQLVVGDEGANLTDSNYYSEGFTVNTISTVIQVS